jgi:transcription termination/antitermination protein NusG
MKWYIIQTNPQYENKVLEEIAKKKADLTGQGLGDKIGEFFSPEESIVTYKDGKKKEAKKKLYSNYIFIEMDFDEKVWHSLNSIKGVANFVGANVGKSFSRPTPISSREIEEIKKRISADAPKPKVMFSENEKVFIKEGPFKEFYAMVREVNYEKNKVRVVVTIFGRETETEMDLSNIQPAE